MSETASHLRRRRPCSVLIADDHDDSRSAQRLVLEDSGFSVIEARSGLDALVLAQASRPRIMLLDIVLPEIDGLQLTRMLRADPTLRGSGIIAVTAHTGQDYRVAAFAAGCDEFVTKPVPSTLLVELVRRYARRPVRTGYELEPLGRIGAIARELAVHARPLAAKAFDEVEPSS
jgi:two-component system cell cycle response regulator DivK